MYKFNQYNIIERIVQAILDTQALYPDCSLADLYDELAMPSELRKAHQQNDLAVMNAYEFDKKITESESVATLMKMYQKLLTYTKRCVIAYVYTYIRCIYRIHQ